MAEISGASRTAKEKTPGWEPDHINPNLQRYWDGSAWTATRRWVAGQWIDESAPVAGASAVSSGAAPTNQNQYVRLPPPVSTSAVHTRHTAVVRPAVGGLLICSVLLILGAFTRVAGALLACDMLGAIIFVHGKNGFFLPKGFEFVLANLGMALALALAGAGALSIDAMLSRRGSPAP